MAQKIGYLTKKGVNEEVHGSDTRLNTSSRSSQRIHYVSRDDGQAYTIVSHDASAAATTYPIYLQNTSSSGLLLYVDTINVGGVESALWKVWFVTGTASGGSPLTAVNMNKASSNAAAITARGGDAIGDLTTDGEITSIRTAATDHDDLRFDDAIILGQNDAIAVEYATGTTGIAEIAIAFYLETSE